METVEHDVIADPASRELMVRRFGRVATPVIVVGKRVFWGFADNRVDIADLLGLSLDSDEEPSAGSSAQTGE